MFFYTRRIFLGMSGSVNAMRSTNVRLSYWNFSSLCTLHIYAFSSMLVGWLVSQLTIVCKSNMQLLAKVHPQSHRPTLFGNITLINYFKTNGHKANYVVINFMLFLA